MTMEDLKALLTSLARSAVRLDIGTGEGPEIGQFGGMPDLPEGFAWPHFVTDTYLDDEVKPRPLAFLCQFDCAALAALDGDGLLPREGVLSFFYELGSQRWGYAPQDAGCARVYWFSEKGALRLADFPETLEEEFRLPALPIRGRMERRFPGYDDAGVAAGKAEGELNWKAFETAYSMTAGKQETDWPAHRLLGWPDIIQSNMTVECELVSRGYNLGGGEDSKGADTGGGGDVSGKLAIAAPAGYHSAGTVFPGFWRLRPGLFLHSNRGPGRPAV